MKHEKTTKRVRSWLQRYPVRLRIDHLKPSKGPRKPFDWLGVGIPLGIGLVVLSWVYLIWQMAMNF